MKNKFLVLVTLLIGLPLLVGAAAIASSEDFYKGKFIRFIVGLPPGGGYDTYTRAVARHIGRHIPGNPTPIVQNMTGGIPSLAAAYYIYSRAKPDGLTVGVWNNRLVLRQALGDRTVKFKSDKFGWIGAPHKGFPTCFVMGFTGLKTLENVLNAKKPIKMGGTVPGATSDDLPRILNLTLGTKFNVITGYDGGVRVLFALQQRAVDGTCLGWESMRFRARGMLDATGDHKLIPFVTYGDSGDRAVMDLPRLPEVIKGEQNRAIVNAWLQQYDFQRPLMLPPGTPKERLSILRRAYKATLEDPKFLAEAKRSRLIIDYVSGEKVEKLVDEILAISPETKAKLQFLVSKKPERQP